MKFKLSYGDLKNFKKSSQYGSFPDPQWLRFWEWIDKEEFPVNESLTTLSEEYFSKMEPKRIMHLSDKEFIKQLGNLYTEHRSDIVEIITAHEQNKLPADWKTYREYRFITFMIPKKIRELNFGDLECQYDTLTGHLEVETKLQFDSGWKTLDGVKYED